MDKALCIHWPLTHSFINSSIQAIHTKHQQLWSLLNFWYIILRIDYPLRNYRALRLTYLSKMFLLNFQCTNILMAKKGILLSFCLAIYYLRSSRLYVYFVCLDKRETRPQNSSSQKAFHILNLLK